MFKVGFDFQVRAYNTLEGIGSSFHYSMPFIGKWN